MIKSLQDCIKECLKGGFNRELPCNLKIEVDATVWTAYTVAMGYREFTFFCDKGTATYFVDSYGDRHTCELIDWEYAQ